MPDMASTGGSFRVFTNAKPLSLRKDTPLVPPYQRALQVKNLKHTFMNIWLYAHACLKTTKYNPEQYRYVNRMQEKTLGRTNLKIRQLGFGGIPIQRVTEKEAVKVVQRCHELGVNYYDTARGYTVSEERMGKALVGIRDEVYIATKSSRRDAEGLLRELEISLRNLQTEYIDVFQLHNVSSPEAWIQIKSAGGALEAARQALKDERIRHLGITSHSPVLLTEIVKEDIFETIMIPYNYLALEPEEELLPLCKEMDVGTVIMKPFGGGAFSNANTAPPPRKRA